MTFEIGLVFAIAAAAVALFASGKLRADLVAVAVMVALMLSRVIEPEEGLAGFSNGATVTVAAMFVLGAGVFRTGALNFVGALLERASARGPLPAAAVLMLGVGVLSAFLNNTAAVALLIPVVLAAARRSKVSPSKLLMPLSYASMFGGVCTLIGTSTNILGNSIAVRDGQPPFGMFEFARLGLLFAFTGGLYMLLAGIPLIPARRTSNELVDTFGLGKYLTEVVLEPDAPSVGKSIADSPLLREMNIEVLEVLRGSRRLHPLPDTVLIAGDVLRVRCDVEQISLMQERVGISLRAVRLGDEQLMSEDTMLIEAVVAPDSVLTGQNLKAARFRQQFGGIVLAIRHRGRLMRERLEQIGLRAGDALLVMIRRDQLEHLRQDRAFLLVSEPHLPQFRRGKIVAAVGIVAAVVVAAATGLVPIVIGAPTGALLMILSAVLEPAEAYRAIDWKVVVLLAGLLALGAAMEKTGAAKLIATGLVSLVGDLGPRAILAALFLLTILLTEVMSNAATVALLMPISIVTAQSLAVSPRPFMFAVMFAASSSFMTPVGYQTNTMIFAPGQYRFSDFVRVGAPLNLLFWAIGSLLIPVLWPF